MTTIGPETFDSAKYLDKLDEAFLKHLAYTALDPRSSKRDAQHARQALSSRFSQRAALAIRFRDKEERPTVQLLINGIPETDWAAREKQRKAIYEWNKARAGDQTE